MDIFRFIEMKVLFLFAQLFKIQSNWFFEAVSMLTSIVIISFLTWAVIKSFKIKKKSHVTGFKKFKQNSLFYLTIILNFIFITSYIVHTAIVIYIANSDYQLSDFTFHEDDLQHELLNIDIYDQNGNKVYTVVNDGVNRETASLNEMPIYLQDAFVDVEDKSFYDHSGVSVMGYLRAIYYKIKDPSSSMHGGSTLTQQLVKNVNGDMYNRNVLHKYQEALLSIVIENKYSKNEILEMYLNRIYLGNGNIHGVGTAAKHYFNKNVSDLNLAESAFLAGLPKAPSSYTENLELGNKRKNVVLSVMKENGSITKSQLERASQKTISFAPKNARKTSSYDAYVDYVLKEAKEDYGITEEDLKNKGYSIYTYLNTNLQNTMYGKAQSFTYKDDSNPQGKKVQVAMAAVDNNRGKIISLYGGRDYVRGYLNRSYNYYQPGSILKPIAVYTPALETNKWAAFSEIMDAKTSFNGYSPKNAGEKYEGNITMQRAIIRSANIPAVTVLQDIGVDKGVETLENLDIEIKEKDKQLHLALGGMEKGVTPIQMAQAYTVFPNNGYFEPAKAIKFIKDKNGHFIDKKDSAKTKGMDVFSSENAFQMTEMLRKVISDPNGTGRNANIGRPVAGKTGTAEEVGTSGNRASWFVGYTPDITMSVHLGFDEPSSNLYLTTSGGDEPAKLFASIMKKALDGTPAKEFEKPLGVKSISEESIPTKVENMKAKYDSKNKQVTITWDKLKINGNMSYKVFKKVKDGDDIEIGTTKEAEFHDKNLTYKGELEEIPTNSDWKEIITVIIKNIIEFISNLIPERNTYYVIPVYQNANLEPSEDDSVFVPKIKHEQPEEENGSQS